MVASKPHMIKAALLRALPVHRPTLPARTAWDCVHVPAQGWGWTGALQLPLFSEKDF